MRINGKKLDIFLLFFLIIILGGVPFGIWAYDRLVKSPKIPPGAKEFTLTGSAQRGWLLGEVQAHDVVTLGKKNAPVEHPVIEVSRGDDVVLKLRSSDVTHGFALKAYDIYIPEWIPVIQGLIMLTGLYLGLGRGYLALENLVQNPAWLNRAMILPSLFALVVVNILLRLYLG